MRESDLFWHMLNLSFVLAQRAVERRARRAAYEDLQKVEAMAAAAYEVIESFPRTGVSFDLLRMGFPDLARMHDEADRAHERARQFLHMRALREETEAGYRALFKEVEKMLEGVC